MEYSQKDALRKTLQAEFDGAVKFDERLSTHTTYKIGGPAFAWATPRSSVELARLVSWCLEHDVRFFVMGGGSNMLCDSRGYEGVVIRLSEPPFQSIRIIDDMCESGGGALLRSVVEGTLSSGLCDLSFLGGIPGTLGGAVAMNAGTRQLWIDSCVHKIEAIDVSSGELAVFSHEDITWGYRYSSLREKYIITRVWLGPLTKADIAQVRNVMKEALGRRKESQPLSWPNAGSVFKNPEGYSSGALIESCGLKGFSIGGAKVSEKHANFIVNTGNASSDDVRTLIKHIQEEVYKRHGIKLQTEIRFLPER